MICIFAGVSPENAKETTTLVRCVCIIITYSGRRLLDYMGFMGFHLTIRKLTFKMNLYQQSIRY